ncbi:conserved hypothetical protein [Chloroflexus aggregans DSM 9485]|uniref:Uncharacterized protein n=2 Tax=Chloroflexus aggregans TaxID=152260 RepID=B8G987_CHLAD|nr:conserved hypothetical protein [Chloroflexus aggregans DSM 9485]
MVAPALRTQQERVHACLRSAIERPALLEAVCTMLREQHGVIALDAPMGSGATTLLAQLAVRAEWPLWLADDDDGGGALAFYAQIAALRRPSLPLVDPAALTDPATFERLLAEVVDPNRPLVLLVSAPNRDRQPLRSLPLPLPLDLPAGVTLLVHGSLPIEPDARIVLPKADSALFQTQASLLERRNCPPGWRKPLVLAARGNLLYLSWAERWLHLGLLDVANLPPDLDHLLQQWWQSLSRTEQRLAVLLAAAGEPLPMTVLAEVSAEHPHLILDRWEEQGLVHINLRRLSEDDTILLVRYAHRAVRLFLARHAAHEMNAAHGELARWYAERLKQNPLDLTNRYLGRQLARHTALCPPAQRPAHLPTANPTTWLRERELREGIAGALRDAGWMLYDAAAGSPLDLARIAAITGTLATRARQLTGDVVVAAFLTAVQTGGREGSLRRVTAIVEQLPDGVPKAAVLRQLGEACYSVNMRSAAMRLLSRALDLEAQPVSRAWRDVRDQAIEALATACLIAGDVDRALACAELIDLLERRAQVETLVIRRLLEDGQYDRAWRLSRSILHENRAAWAQAEVAVALERIGDPRGAMMLDELKVETARAWAEIELACEVALRDEEAALRRIMALPGQHQRDRGLARLARVFAHAEKDGDALAAAERISNRELRVTTLLELRVLLQGLVANLATERATREIDALQGEDRPILLAALASAHAAIGRKDRALAIANQLRGEELERALSRVAVACVQAGDYAGAQAVLAQMTDDDERDWARDEIARTLASIGDWESAMAQAMAIVAADQRARTSADLAITRARSGDVLTAVSMIRAIEVPAERGRALVLIAPLLATTDATLADQLADELLIGEVRSRYRAALVVALAERGELATAAKIARRIRRRNERVRAELAIIVALDPTDPMTLARLATTLAKAAVGREEMFHALELVIPLLQRIGGTPLLADLATAIVADDRA